MTCFTDKEEAAVNLVDQMPFLLETRLKELGANFTSADNFQCHVVVNIKFLITRAQKQDSGGENHIKKLVLGHSFFIGFLTSLGL